MSDYKTMYQSLFNKISDIILELQTIQIQTEEMYITASDDNEINLKEYGIKKDT